MRRFEARARQALLEPGGCEPVLSEGWSLVWRLWHTPAFEPQRAWAVFTDLQKRAGLAVRMRRVTWDAAAERERCSAPMSLLEAHRFIQNTPTPLLTVEEGRVPPERWAALLAESPRLRLPGDWDPSRMAFLDGECFGLEHRAFGRATRFLLEWDQQPPEELGEVAAWAERVRAFLDECVGGIGEE